MTKKTILGISYVSVWVVIWGTIGSFIDYPLLKANIYAQGSIGQISTFVLTGLASIALGILLFSNIMKRFD